MTTSADFVNHNRRIDCEPGETLLRAGLRAGLSLPYECASGGCGSCRAQLLEGSVESLWPEATGLTDRDRRRGNRILMCQSVPTEDCRLKAPALGEEPTVPEPVPQRRMAILRRREMLTDDTALFELGFDEPVEYLPGQFMLLEFGDGVRRAYSMAHPASIFGSTAIDFIIRAKPGGAGSRWLFERIEPGDEVVVEGPYGRAYARHDTDRPVVSIAGGTGLAPVLAITDQILLQENCPRVHFYFGVRRKTDLVVIDRLEKLAAKGAQVTLSVQEPANDLTTPTGMAVRPGLVIDSVAQDWDDLSSHDVYLAGPAGMVDAALRALVRERKALADRVFFDRFIA